MITIFTLIVFFVFYYAINNRKEIRHKKTSKFDLGCLSIFLIISLIAFYSSMMNSEISDPDVISFRNFWLGLMCILSPVVVFKLYQTYSRSEINSHEDLTPKLLNKILENKIKRLYINYEFEYLDDNPFYHLRNEITSVDFEIILDPKIRDLSVLFADCINLKSVRSFDTSHVTNMAGMFQNCHSLIEAPMLNLSSVTTILNMFAGCTSLEKIPLYDTKALINCESMVEGCKKLREFPKFNVSKLSHDQLEHLQSSIKNNCAKNLDYESLKAWGAIRSLELISADDLTQENLTLIANNQIDLLKISYPCTRVPNNEESLFSYYAWMEKNNPFFRIRKNLFDLHFKILFDEKVTSLSHLFIGCSNLKSIDKIDGTEHISDFSYMFGSMHDPEHLFGNEGCANLKQIPLFDTSSGINFEGMFSYCTKLSVAPKFNTANAQNVSLMFAMCSSLSSKPELVLNTNIVQSDMYAGCSNLKAQIN